MTINLDEIEKALADATPSDKWSYDGGDNANASLTIGEMDCDISRMSRYTHELVSSRGEMEANAHLIAHAPKWLRLLVERVRKLEVDVMRVDVVLEAAKAVVEDGEYDVHYESRSAALIDSGLLLRLENAVKAIDAAKESTT